MMSSFKIEQICDMCHIRPRKQGHLFPCSGCGIFKYCSPRCQRNHLPLHEKDCRELRSSAWSDADYKSFYENDKIKYFLCAFSYHCRLKNIDYQPSCMVNIQDGVFVAFLKEQDTLEEKYIIKIDKEKEIQIFLGLNEPSTNIFNYQARIFSLNNTRNLYLLYKPLFDNAVDIQLQVYKPGCYPKGMKDGAILVIFIDKEGNQKLAYI